MIGFNGDCLLSSGMSTAGIPIFKGKNLWRKKLNLVWGVALPR